MEFAVGTTIIDGDRDRVFRLPDPARVKTLFWKRLRLTLRIALPAGLVILCAGCQTFPFEFPKASISPGLEDVYVYSNEPAVVGRKQFERGNYGLSERYFREAVEANPEDLASWIGLGASYDHLKRFDLADRAYEQAFRLGAPRAHILNNRGYSSLLRGDFTHARTALQKALAIEPGNPIILNNLRLLDSAEAKFRRSLL